MAAVFARPEESAGMPASMVLVFPPLTEARQFPYLSLPVLAAYLRQRGLALVQRDFNVELCHRLLAEGPLHQVRSRVLRAKPSLAQRYRLAFCDYLLEHHAALYRSVFEKAGATAAGMQHDVRFVRNGIELMLEHSALSLQRENFDDVDLRANSLEVSSEDTAAQLLHAMLREALRPGVRVLGLSVAFFSQLPSALLIARWAKALYPSLFVVLGGPHVMLWHQRLAQLRSVRQWVDGLCIGPGEECLARLHDVLCAEGGLAVREYDSVQSGQLAAVPELVLPTVADAVPPRSKLHINDLPPPDFEGLPLRGYLAEEAHLCLVTCVGCYWGRCTFCSYGNRSADERGYQQASPRWIVNACRHLVDVWGITRINFVDENTNLRVVASAVRELRATGVHIQFSTRNRLESILLDKDFCNELARDGCVLMSAGYETNSQRLLDQLDKGVVAAQYQRIIDNLHEAGINLRLSVMGGVLDETAAERDASLAFLESNADRIGIDVMQMLVVEPNTRLARNMAVHSLQPARGGLRGNKLLNYRFGRVGYDFDYVDGDTFNQRLAAFVTFFHRVAPQKNDELPPQQRWQSLSELPSNVRALRLWPWVQILKSDSTGGTQPDTCVLVDMLWERFYELPMPVDNMRLVVAPEGHRQAQSVLRSLVPLGVAETVYLDTTA